MRVMVLVFVTVITAIYVAVIRSIHRQEDVSLDMKFWSVVVASTVLGLTIIWFAVRRIRFVGRDALISQLFSLCVLLEMNNHMFDKPNFKRALNRRIEACARRIEILPLTFGAEGDPATRMELGLLAGQIATHFRKNKILVVKGGQDRYQCLLTAMLEALSQISQNKWFELPTAPCAPSRRASRTSRAGWIGLFILGLMALLAVAYCGTTGDLGVSVAGVLIPILGVFLTFSLTKLGVKITALKQVAEVSTQIAKAG
jgi:hypothetical protein